MIFAVEAGWGSQSRDTARSSNGKGESYQRSSTLRRNISHSQVEQCLFSVSRRDDLAPGSLNRRFQLGLCAWQVPRSYFNRSYKGRGLGKTCRFWSELTISFPLVASKHRLHCGIVVWFTGLTDNPPASPSAGAHRRKWLLTACGSKILCLLSL